MFCEKCGSKIDDATGLCPMCDAEKLNAKREDEKKIMEQRFAELKEQINAQKSSQKPNEKSVYQSLTPEDDENDASRSVNQAPEKPNIPFVGANQGIPPVPTPPGNFSPSQPPYSPPMPPVPPVNNNGNNGNGGKNNGNSGKKVKKAVLKTVAVILAAIIAMTAVAGVLVYYDKADFPIYASVLEKTGIKGTKTNTTDTFKDSENKEELDSSKNKLTKEQLKDDADTSLLDGLTPGTDSEVKQLNKDSENVEKAIDVATNEAKSEYGELTQDNVDDYLYAVEGKLYELQSNSLISEYSRSDNSITVTFNSGIKYCYIPEVEGTDSGADSSKLQIGTYQPCLSGYDDSVSSYMTYVDDGAQKIDDSFDAYNFYKDNTENDHDYNDSEVTFKAIVQGSQNNLFLWHGHGDYNTAVGSKLVTGEKVTEDSRKQYYQMLKEGSVELLSSTYLITSKFITNYVKDNAFDNSVVYLGTCSSGVDSVLADAFIDKGACAVLANTGVIQTTYNLSMIKEFCNGLTLTYNETDRHYTCNDALNYAKEINGDYDPVHSNTEVVIYGTSSFSLDWYQYASNTSTTAAGENASENAERDIVLVLDRSGSMDGDPLEQTKQAATNFVDTVLRENANVGIVTYDSESAVDSSLSMNANTLFDSINNISAGGSTNIESGLASADAMLQTSDAKKKIIVLMSDGAANEGKQGSELTDYAKALRDKGYYIYTLGFFSSLSESEKTQCQQVLNGIASEGCHYEVSDAGDLVFFFDDIANQINGTRYIYVKIACPVDVEVTSGDQTLSSKDDKTRTDFGSLTFENEDTGESDSYSDDSEESSDTVKILRLKEGVDYDINITGYDKGKMNYTIGFMDENGEYSDTREFKSIKITDDTQIDTVASNTDTTVLNVDEDGDGRYDSKYIASENSDGELFVTPWWAYAAIFGSGGFVILIAVVITVANASKKKKKAAAAGFSTVK